MKKSFLIAFILVGFTHQINCQTPPPPTGSTPVPPTDSWASFLYAEDIFPTEVNGAVPFQLEKGLSRDSLAGAIEFTVDQLKNVLSSPETLGQMYTNYLIKYQNILSKDAFSPGREKIFATNLVNILRHNLAAKAGLSSWTQGVTRFSYLTNQEFQARFTPAYNISAIIAQYDEDDDLVSMPSLTQAPDSFNWVDEGMISPVKNQETCGSCYAFGSLANLETAYARKYNKRFYDLSEQEIVDCATPYGASGCRGGFPKQVYQYINDKGINQEGDYRYKDQEQACKRTSKRKLTPRITYKKLKANDEDQLAQDIANIGPVTVIVSSINWNHYKEGTYEDGDGVFTHGCGNDPYSEDNKNHLVLIVGYTPDYFLIKNSWGKDWGYDGYIRLKRGGNVCGVSDFPDTIASIR